MSTHDLAPYLWPAERTADAVGSLALRAKLVPRGTVQQTTERKATEQLTTEPTSNEQQTTERKASARKANARNAESIRVAALGLGIEARPVVADYPDVIPMLRRAAPAVLELGDSATQSLLVLLGRTRSGLRVLRPDGETSIVTAEVVRSALCERYEAPLRAGAERLLDRLSLEGKRRSRVRQTFLDEHLTGIRVEGVHLLRPSPGGSFRKRLVQAGVSSRFAAMVLTHAAQYALWIVAWALIGRSALVGRDDPGTLWAWGLLLLTLVPLRAAASWFQATVSVRIGAALKERLVQGATRLDPDEVRTLGVGGQLGRVIESEAVELYAIQGGFLVVLAAIELVFATWVLGRGAAPVLQPLLLLATLLVVAWLGRCYYRERGSWTERRLEMTADLIERMVGHRTRLAQEPMSEWHREEDRLLHAYYEGSKPYDQIGVLLTSSIGRGWLLAATLGLLPALSSGTSLVPVAVSLGGMLLAQQSLQKLVLGTASLGGAVVSWTRIQDLFRAAARPEQLGTRSAAVVAEDAARDDGHARARTREEEPAHEDAPPSRLDDAVYGTRPPLLEGAELVYRYPRRMRPALERASFEVHSGARVLLTGPSGSGKSTWLSVVLGLREPSAGTLLASGFDRTTWGDAGWRRQIAASPQFHENYILSGSLAFNLLMGRRWPATPDDYVEAERICRRLGLGPLLDRMPSGILQHVGESGWQLSHGERSRVYVARAILQGAPVVALDESLGALDPEAFRTCLETLDEEVDALVLVAH